jgi:signal peptidase II
MQATRGTAVAESERGSAPRRTRTVLATAFAVLVADIVSKVVVVATMDQGDTVRLIDGILKIDYTRNAGAAFSIGTGATVLFTGVAVLVAAVIIRQARRLVSRSWAVTLGLLLGGALGNLVDRIFRSPGPFRGHVVDWIELPHWPVFNLADSAIVIGGVVAVLLATRGTPLDSRPADAEAHATETQP